jgi:hypothetical protein
MVVQAEVDVQALSYLVTAVIHRLHETDPAWWREFLGEMRSERKAVPGDTVQVLDRAIAIVEHAVKPQTSMAVRHGQ